MTRAQIHQRLVREAEATIAGFDRAAERYEALGNANAAAWNRANAQALRAVVAQPGPLSPSLIRNAANLLKSAVGVAGFLEALANKLDGWASESRSGGWSTHQVSANKAAADDCRRQAAAIKAISSKASGGAP